MTMDGCTTTGKDCQEEARLFDARGNVKSWPIRRNWGNYPLAYIDLNPTTHFIK